MTDFPTEPQGLEARVVYSGVTTDGEEHVDVLYTEEPVPEPGGVKNAVADAASAVGDRASDAASAVGDAAGGAASAMTGAVSDAAETVKEAAPSRQQLKRGAHRIGELAQDSPLGLALTGACVGFLAGMLLPTTTVDEKIAPYAEQVVDRARDAGHTAVEQGRQAMQKAAPAVGAALRG